MQISTILLKTTFITFHLLVLLSGQNWATQRLKDSDSLTHTLSVLRRLDHHLESFHEMALWSSTKQCSRTADRIIMSDDSDSIKIMALGRQFTIGTLYNYIEGSVVPSMRLWDPDDVSPLTEVQTESKKTAKVYKMAAINQKDDDDDQHEFALSSMGMDDYSSLNFLAGLTTPTFGCAWQYVVDRISGKMIPKSDEVAVHYRCVSKKILLDPTEKLEIICHLDKLKQSKATHVVVAVTYGLEAFCHFSYKNPSENDNNTLEKLLNHAQNFADSFSNESEHLLPLKPSTQLDLECILYSDSARNQPISNLSSLPVNKQYETCKKVLNIPASKPVPLKIRLYPLDQLLPTKAIFYKMPVGLGKNQELMIRFQKMWKLWQRITMETNTITKKSETLNNGSSILSTSFQKMECFKKCVQNFQSNLIKALAEWTLSVRRGNLKEEELFEILDNIESESPFCFEKLNGWLNHQAQQIKTLKILTKLPAVRFISEIPELRERVQNQNQYPFILVLHLPSMADSSDNLVDDMEDYVKAFCSSQMVHVTNKKNLVKPSRINYRQIFEAGQQFSNWVSEHNNDSTLVDYIIFYNEQMDTDGKPPFFKLYESGSANVIYDNFTFPEAPGEVTVKENRRGIITIEWDSKENYDFLLQYRRAECKENEPWQSIEHSTNSITISFLQSDQTYFFRVAVLTLAGRSPFSPISEEITIDSVCPPPSRPRCRFVTDSSIDITWDHQHDINQNLNKLQISFYSVECWVDGSREDSTLIQRPTKDKKIILEPLGLGTTYCIQIRAVCVDSKGSTFSSSTSPILKVRTLQEPERAANIVRRDSQICSSGSSGIAIYQLPLKKYRGITTPGVGHFVFGQQSYLSLFGKRRQRTVLMLGATGSGKSTLINAMVNYVLGVEWNDSFRFKLIDEPANKSQAHSQTDFITTYDFYQMKGSRLDYSLTLVDTPGFGDTRGLEKDKKIMDQIRDYFKSNHGIQQLEAVCFVVQSALPRLTPTQQYIFDSILSIFSQEIKDNIRLMVTFSDISVPPVLAAVKEAKIPSPVDPKTGLPLHHKFNNSIFFTSKQSSSEINEINETYFNVAVEGFDRFFDDLSRMEAKSLTLTREVLEERKKLEALVEGLQIRTQMKLIRVDELEKIKKILTENQDQIDASKDNEYEILVPKSTDISGTGQFTTNCQNCKMTCHFPCRQAHDENKHRCSVMNSNGSCMICKCDWSKHFNQKYRYEMVMEKKTCSSDTIRQQYQAAQKEQMTNEQLLKNVEKDIEEQEKQLVELMQATHPHIRRLDEIALRPHPFSTPAYIDLMIAAEKQEHRQGYQQRIVTLEKLRQMAVLTAKLIEDQGKSQRIQPPTPQIQRRTNIFQKFFG